MAAVTTGAELPVVVATKVTRVCKSSSHSWKAHANLSQARVATAKVAATAASRVAASGRD